MSPPKTSTPAEPVYPPITVTRAPGQPLRITFPAPEESPIGAVREPASVALAWDAAVDSAMTAFEVGDWQRVQDGVWADEPATEAGARTAIARAGYAADDHYRVAEAAESQWLREQLPPKAKIRRDGGSGYLVRGDVFALVARLHRLRGCHGPGAPQLHRRPDISQLYRLLPLGQACRLPL